ncbi:MAG: HAD family hydrolase [Erysipelotrichaceae bacterium]
MEAVIFDLDGTIIDTIDGVKYAADLTLEKFGYPPHDRLFYVGAIGGGARNLIVKALGPDSKDETVVSTILKDFLVEYANNWSVGLSVYKGIYELIDQLLARGMKIGVNTNKPDNIAQNVVRKFFDEKQIVEIVGSQSTFPNKPNPAGTFHILDHFNVLPQNSVYIGDSLSDILTAKNCGMPSIICTWGYGNSDEFKEADFIVNHPEEILKLI